MLFSFLFFSSVLRYFLHVEILTWEKVTLIKRLVRKKCNIISANLSNFSRENVLQFFIVNYVRSVSKVEA